MYSKFVSSLLVLFIGNVFLLTPVGADEQSAYKNAYKEAYVLYLAAAKAQDAVAAAEAAGEALKYGKGVFINDWENRPYEEDGRKLADLYLNLSTALLASGDIEGALAPLAEATERFNYLYRESTKKLILKATFNFEKLSGRSDEKTIKYFKLLSEAFQTIGNSTKAAASLLRIYVSVRENSGRNSEAFADLNLALGIQFFRSGDTYKGTKRYFETANRIYNKLLGREAAKTAEADYWLGKIYLERGSNRKALDYLTRSLSFNEKHAAPGSEQQLALHAHLVQAYEEMGETEKATEHCRAISRKRPSQEVDGYHPLYRKKPKYPGSAIQLRKQGWVIVEFTVTDAGTVADPHVVESRGGVLFEKSALEAIEDFRYAPAIVDGEFVNTPGVKSLFSFIISN